jgi:hypothetical protein
MSHHLFHYCEITAMIFHIVGNASNRLHRFPQKIKIKRTLAAWYCSTVSAWEHMGSGLPDFSRYKIPKWEKDTKLQRTIPNVNKI